MSLSHLGVKYISLLFQVLCGVSASFSLMQSEKTLTSHLSQPEAGSDKYYYPSDGRGLHRLLQSAETSLFVQSNLGG